MIHILKHGTVHPTYCETFLLAIISTRRVPFQHPTCYLFENCCHIHHSAWGCQSNRSNFSSNKHIQHIPATKIQRLLPLQPAISRKPAGCTGWKLKFHRDVPAMMGDVMLLTTIYAGWCWFSYDDSDVDGENNVAMWLAGHVFANMIFTGMLAWAMQYQYQYVIRWLATFVSLIYKIVISRCWKWKSTLFRI